MDLEETKCSRKAAKTQRKIVENTREMNMADSAILFGIETPVEDLPDDTIKTCCAAVYQSEWIRLLIGDSLHPGGLVLTEQLGLLTDLGRLLPGPTVWLPGCGARIRTRRRGTGQCGRAREWPGR
jgi:hypothetical protein